MGRGARSGNKEGQATPGEVSSLLARSSTLQVFQQHNKNFRRGIEHVFRRFVEVGGPPPAMPAMMQQQPPASNSDTSEQTCGDPHQTQQEQQQQTNTHYHQQSRLLARSPTVLSPGNSNNVVISREQFAQVLLHELRLPLEEYEASAQLVQLVFDSLRLLQQNLMQITQPRTR
jgi:hypothetical protein